MLKEVIGYEIYIRKQQRSIFLKLSCGHEIRRKISQVKSGIPKKAHCNMCKEE